MTCALLLLTTSYSLHVQQPRLTACPLSRDMSVQRACRPAVAGCKCDHTHMSPGQHALSGTQQQLQPCCLRLASRTLIKGAAWQLDSTVFAAAARLPTVVARSSCIRGGSNPATGPLDFCTSCCAGCRTDGVKWAVKPAAAAGLHKWKKTQTLECLWVPLQTRLHTPCPPRHQVSLVWHTCFSWRCRCGGQAPGPAPAGSPCSSEDHGSP